MVDKERLVELASFGEGGIAFGCGLLGATGATPDDARAARLNEIERRILAIEAALRSLSTPSMKE